jgi:single-strand DNA-binding protein
MVNAVYLIGNLAAEPEAGKSKTTAYTKFVLISNGRVETQKAVVTVTVFGKAAAYAAGFRKGHRVFVSGRLDTSSWKSQDGQPRSKTSVIAELVFPVEPIAPTETKKR